MRIALCSDELYPFHGELMRWLINQGHSPVGFGSFQSGQRESWINVTQEASSSIAQGTCQEGIFFCWSGTGVSIVANKTPGIRAALCWDEEIIRLARIWNHANVLVLANRLFVDFQKPWEPLLSAWFSPYDKGKGGTDVSILKKL